MTGRSPWRTSVGEDDDDGEGEEEAVARSRARLLDELLDSCLLEVWAGRDGRRGDRFGVARTREARERWDGSRCVPLGGPSRLVRAQAGSIVAAGLWSALENEGLRFRGRPLAAGFAGFAIVLRLFGKIGTTQNGIPTATMLRCPKPQKMKSLEWKIKSRNRMYKVLSHVSVDISCLALVVTLSPKAEQVAANPARSRELEVFP